MIAETKNPSEVLRRGGSISSWRRFAAMVDPLIQLVPAVLRPIAERLGYAAVVRVVRAVGGQRLPIPVTARPNGKLARKIGVDAVAVLVEHHKGLNLQFPRAHRLVSAVRDAAIQADNRSNNMVAADFALTSRSVATIRNQVRRLPPALIDAVRELYPNVPVSAQRSTP